MFPLVSPDDLQRQLSHEHVVIFDCRFDLAQPEAGERCYQEAHIPGSHYAHLEWHLSDMNRLHAGRHPLPSADRFANFLASKGVTNTSTIVAYDDQRGAFAARLWWLCRYFGLERVAILDGGFGGWLQAGGPTSTGMERLYGAPATLRLKPRPQRVITLHALEEERHREDVVLIDSRSRDRYCGKQEPLDAAAGHIPGAVQAFWQACTDDNGRWHDTEWHKERWQRHVRKNKVVYCGSGVTACVNLVSLDMAGQWDSSRLFPGSWSEWSTWHRQQQTPERAWLATC